MNAFTSSPKSVAGDVWHMAGDTNRLCVDWATAFAAGVMHAQQLQVEMLICWQAAMAQIGKEVWDEWRCRFAGGAPIDG